MIGEPLDLSRTRLFAFNFDGTLVQSNALKRSTYYEVVEGIRNAAGTLDEVFATRQGLDRLGIFTALARRIAGFDAYATTYTIRCE